MQWPLVAAARVLNFPGPCRYGITEEDKLKVGSKICSELLGKILCDLGNMREESLATASKCCCATELSARSGFPALPCRMMRKSVGAVACGACF